MQYSPIALFSLCVPVGQQHWQGDRAAGPGDAAVGQADGDRDTAHDVQVGLLTCSTSL